MTITDITRPTDTRTSVHDSPHPLWWNPWMAFYCKWLKVFTAENDESAMRRYIRHPSDMPINFQVNESLSPIPHKLKDVSIGGLCFGSDKPLRKGTVIHIHIPVVLKPLSREKQPVTEGAELLAETAEGAEPHTMNPFDADGVVAWCRPEVNGYSIGVQFADASTQFGLRMVEQVCHIEHYRADVLREEGRVLTREEAAREWIERYAAEFPH